MSSSSSYKPDESDSDDDFQIPLRTRATQSLSQTEIPSNKPSSLYTLDGADRDDGDEDEQAPDSSQTRHEWLDGQLKNLDPRSLHAYSGILASVEKDSNFENIAENDDFLSVSQNGVVVWTATEKGVLFNVLGRKGKNGIKDIAAAIGTKSELEVMDYLRLLHHKLGSLHFHQRLDKTVIMGDIPAAAEISEECCAELDEYADVLAVKEDIETSKACRMQYGNYGTISDVQAKELVDSEENTPLRGSIHLAGNLLNVPNWVHLSRRFFMNFGGKKEQDNWTNLVQSRDESPSISGDALMDFYALTISLTRRLIQSAIFFAMARLRSAQASGRERSNKVRTRDMRTAIDVLNMKSKPPDFLLQSARRNCLVIADITNQKGWVPRVYSYDEAAEILHGDGNDSEHATDDGHTTETDYGLSYKPPHLAQSSGDDPAVNPEEEHADILDREASRREELMLWGIMGQSAPPLLNVPIISEEDTKDAQQKPGAERKSRQEMVEWRDRTLYRSEWEEYGSDLEDVERDLAEHRRKRRRVEEDPTESESESEEDEDLQHPQESDDQADTEPEGTQLGKSTKTPVFRSASVVNSDDSSSDVSADDQEPGVEDVNMHEHMDVDEMSEPT